MDLKEQYITNIKVALINNYNVNVGNMFVNYVNDEEFDAEAIEDDINDYDDCSILDYLSEKFSQLFESDNQKDNLFKVLQNGFNGKIERIIHLFIENINCSVNSKQINEAEEYFLKYYDWSVQTESILKIWAIGQQNGM